MSGKSTHGHLQYLKEGSLPEIEDNSFQHNFATVNGEKLTDTVLKAEISIENKENKCFEFRQLWGCGTKSLFRQIWVKDT